MLLALCKECFPNIRNENYFLSGGEDKMLNLWKYDEGICYYRGEGHAGHIKKVKLKCYFRLR